jgi:hypothetical protein
MLAMALALGLALAGCSNGSTDTPKTVDGLFDALKGFNAGRLKAWADGFDDIVWCYGHNAWEPLVNDRPVHGGTPAFTLANAGGLNGGWNTNDIYDANAAILKEYISVLDSFFEPQYRTGQTETRDQGRRDDGGQFIYYDFWLSKDGYGGYGGSATPVTKASGVNLTFTVNHYKF